MDHGHRRGHELERVVSLDAGVLEDRDRVGVREPELHGLQRSLQGHHPRVLGDRLVRAGRDRYAAAFTEASDNTAQLSSVFTFLVWSGSGATGNVNLTRNASVRGNAVIAAFKPAATATNFNGDVSSSSTATVSTAGVVGAVAGAALAATVALTAAGVVGTQTGASLPATDSITATGTMAATGGATLAATNTVTATGVVGTSAGAAIAATDTITATGVVGRSTGASIAATGTITAAGTTVAGGTAGATVAETGTLTAAGFVGESTGATIGATTLRHTIAEVSGSTS